MKGLEAFAGKRVLVTGHSGFKGTWLATWLCELGAEVLGYALPCDDPNGHFNTSKLRDRIQHVEGDVRDLQKLRKCFDSFEPEVVMHLAAQSLVRESYAAPSETFAVNVGGSVNVLECTRTAQSVRALVYVTSDKCYDNREWVWGYRETDTMGGHDPYSASKGAAELVFAAYSSSFFAQRPNFGAASARAGNVIGGGDFAADRIVPDVVRSLMANRAIELRNPEATRPWQHVLEPLGGYLALGAALLSEPRRFSGAWNFGPDLHAACTVRQLVEELIRAWGTGSIKIAREADAPHEARLLQLCTDKARALLGWSPRWSLEQCVDATASWYKAAASGEDTRALTLAQIRSYMAQPRRALPAADEQNVPIVTPETRQAVKAQ